MDHTIVSTEVRGFSFILKKLNIKINEYKIMNYSHIC